MIGHRGVFSGEAKCSLSPLFHHLISKTAKPTQAIFPKSPERMQNCRSLLPSISSISLLSMVVLLSLPAANAYKNYTVGDSLGWYDNLMEPKVDYQKWVAGKNFSLGDFLIFHTNKNHSVVQTYNVTTYKRCDYYDAEEDDTIEWSAGAPEVGDDAVTVAVPLVKEGTTYFFSGDYDGEQCQHGQHFKIDVTHGQGLPESLRSPEPNSPAPANPADDGSTVPDTVVPSNFDHPTESAPVKVSSGAGETLAMLMRKECGGFNYMILLLIAFLLVIG